MENDETERLVDELRRFRAKAPPSELQSRIFADDGNGILSDLIRLAALLLIYLGLVFALFPARSGLHSKAKARSSFSSINMDFDIMRGSDHD
jgi:hypothetical protein